MRLIDADALLEKVWDADTRVGYVQVVDRGDIENAPTIEERKRGRWIPKPIWQGAESNFYACSICDYRSWSKDNYCSVCGADMRGDSDG